MGARNQESIQEELVRLQRTDTALDQLTPEIIATQCDTSQLGSKDFPRMLVVQ